MSIKKFRPESPDRALNKIKGDTEFARLAHLNRLVDDINQTNISGPQGPQGIQGPAGPQGVPGPVGPAGLTWKGSWSSGTSYAADDAVGYDGASWFCILDTSGTTAPDVDTTHWALLASQGAQGPAGATGAQGPTGPQGPSGALDAWGLLGNTGTNSTTNFIGTTDAKNVVFKANNITRMYIDQQYGDVYATKSFRAYASGTTSVQALSSSGNGGVIISQDSTDKGYIYVSNGSGETTIKSANLTGSRTLQLPDKDGTLATEDYKVYTAIITQAATGAPTATVLKNTLGFTPTFGYGTVGLYSIVSSAAWTINKTIIFINNGKIAPNITVGWTQVNNSQLVLFSYDGAALANDSITNASIEIRIYP